MQEDGNMATSSPAKLDVVQQVPKKVLDTIPSLAELEGSGNGLSRTTPRSLRLKDRERKVLDFTGRVVTHTPKTISKGKHRHHRKSDETVQEKNRKEAKEVGRSKSDMENRLNILEQTILTARGRNRVKDKERERGKDRTNEKEPAYDKGRHYAKEKDKEKDKEKEKDKDEEKEKEKERGNEEKERGHDKDKEKVEKEKEKEKEDKEKEKERGKERERGNEKDKDKDRVREKDIKPKLKETDKGNRRSTLDEAQLHTKEKSKKFKSTENMEQALATPNRDPPRRTSGEPKMHTHGDKLKKGGTEDILHFKPRKFSADKRQSGDGKKDDLLRSSKDVKYHEIGLANPERKKSKGKRRKKERASSPTEEIDTSSNSTEAPVNAPDPTPDLIPPPKLNLSDSKPPEKKSNHKFKDLPEAIQKKCIQVKLDMNLMEENIELLFTIAQFLYKDQFKIEVNNNAGGPRNPYASEEQLKKARGLIQIPDKKQTKLFKKPVLSGSGGFGTVYYTKDSSTKKRIAIKKLPHVNPRNIENNEAEIYFLSECKHPNIVELYSCYLVKDKDKPEELWITMEFLEGGTLGEAAKIKSFSDRHIAYTARECLKGIQYLHDKGFAHRDLKSSNVMMSITGEIKLIDFGLCADMTAGPRTKLLGSPYWIPPEMILNKEHSYSADIWSFSVCIMELFMNEPPYAGSALNCMFKVATEGLLSVIPKRASKEAQHFLKLGLNMDPAKRATAHELLQHPWFQQPNLEKGLVEILREIFLTNSLQNLGF